MKNKIIEILHERVPSGKLMVSYETLADEIVVLFTKKLNLLQNTSPVIFMGEGVEYWANLQHYARENMMDTLIKDKIRLERTIRGETVDYAGIDPAKWEGVDFATAHTLGFDMRESKVFPLARVDKYTACPEELKEAYRAIRDVREALLKLERRME